MKSEQITMEWLFNASIDKAWKAITEKDQMKQWYFPMLESFKPEPGFQTQFNVHQDGKDFLHIWKVTDVVSLKKISYEWKYGGFPGNSLVTFELFPEGDKTKLVLTQANLETFLPEANPGLAKDNFVQGWTQLVGKQLKGFLENEK